MIPRLISGNFFQHWQDIAPESVDLILTDPPYGTLGRLHDWDRVPDLNRLEGIFSRLLKPTGTAVMFCDFKLMNKIFNTFTHTLTYRNYLVWHKPSAMPSNPWHPLPDSEFLLVYIPKGAKVSECTWHPKALGEPGDPYFKRSNQLISPTRRQVKTEYQVNSTGERFARSVIKAPSKCNMSESERTVHPTQKPLELLRKLIQAYSNPEDLVLEPFAGSGSTLVAAYHSLRHSIGFEIREDYFDLAQNRIDENCSQTAFI